MFTGIRFTASLSFVYEEKSRVPIYAWTDISKKFYEEKCTLSFAKWKITLCVLELQGGKYKFVLHSHVLWLLIHLTWGEEMCGDVQTNSHITGLLHKYLCRIWQGCYFLVVKRTAFCDNVCSSFLDTALHEFLLNSSRRVHEFGVYRKRTTGQSFVFRFCLDWESLAELCGKPKPGGTKSSSEEWVVCEK